MPSISMEDLKDKYPKMYHVLKCAHDLRSSTDMFEHELKYIISECDRDASEENKREMKERLSIMQGVITLSLDNIEAVKTLYEGANKILKGEKKGFMQRIINQRR